MLHLNTHAKKISAFMICLLLPLGLGFLSSALSGDIKAKYAAMNTPPLSPPGWLFGVVWPILFVLMGIASYIVLTKTESLTHPALIVYCVQLLMNFIWSIIFFGADSKWIGSVLCVVLAIAVAICIVLFARQSKIAAAMLIPYMVWLMFANYLSFGVAILN